MIEQVISGGQTGERTMSEPKTIKVRIPCLVDAEGRWAAANRIFTNGPQIADETNAFRLLGGKWSDDVAAHVVWITADVPLPVSIEVEGKVEP